MDYEWKTKHQNTVHFCDIQHGIPYKLDKDFLSL